MKKQTKTAMKLSVIAMIVSAFMMLEACTETVQKQKIPGATYMGGNNTITEICKELDSAGAAHVDIFREWAVDFADSAGKNAKLEDTWSDPGKMKADIGKCISGALYGYLKHKDCRKALEYGNAMAAIKHSVIGDMITTDLEEIDSIIAEHKNTGYHSEMNR